MGVVVEVEVVGPEGSKGAVDAEELQEEGRRKAVSCVRIHGYY